MTSGNIDYILRNEWQKLLTAKKHIQLKNEEDLDNFLSLSEEGDSVFLSGNRGL